MGKPSKFDAVGVHLKYYLEDDEEWHDGMVEEYHPRRGYHIQLFDGHDAWVNSLDENVQLEDELNLDDTAHAGGKTMQTEMSFHDDELAILQDAEDVLQAEDPVDDDFNHGSVPDYRSHQDYNQRAIRADLPALPPRGVLLCGSVLGAAGLVVDNDEAMEGEVFFKVLFVEGGSQPAMFRCKTPIFTSPPVARSLSNPVWPNARFQFDMIMPVDAVQDLKSPYGFKIQGEIIVAVYMSRSSGGNTLLGQASFQLKDVVETGTVEYFLAGYEGRSVTGAHTILSRTGEVSGEVDVQLNIAWKSLNNGLGMSTTVSQSKLAGLPPRPASASATATRAGSAPRGGADSRTKSAAASGRDGSAPRARPAGAANKGTIPPPRKIVSNIQRKQREDAARIARENKKLQQTLHQHANRNGRPPATAVTTAYGAPPGGSVAASRPTSAPLGGRTLSATADAKETAESRDYKASGRTAASAKGTSDAQVIEGLLRMYNDLKRTTALDEQENMRLKLKVGKLKVSVKQAEMSVDRIRSESGGGGDAQSKGSLGGMRTSLRGSGESHRRSREGLFESDPKDTPVTARSQLGGASVTSGTADRTVRQGEHEYIPYFAPMTEAEMRALGVQDGEYKSLAEEYNVLQTVRRGLLDRLSTAKKACNAAGEKQQTAQERMDMIRRRVDYYRDIAGKLAIGVHLQLEGGGTVGAKQAAVEDSSHQDFVLFDRLREGKQELVTESAIYEAGMHTMAAENALEELRAVRNFLASKCATAEQSVRQLKDENDAIHAQLRAVMSSKQELNVNAYVQQLRAERGRHGRRGLLSAAAEERLKAANDGLVAVDKQLQGVKERQGERRNSKAGGAVAMVELDV